MKVCRGAPIISHFLFADDNFLFFWANESEVVAMQSILVSYENASG